jgi:2-desacetyl-2-hydroxyethyl bacteriochlorophyllide A dehydrogenase
MAFEGRGTLMEGVSATQSTDVQSSVYFEAPYRIGIQRRACPQPGNGEVLVRTHLSAVSAGTELLVYRGQLPESLPLDATFGGRQGRPSYPMAYGYCQVGSVIACGDAVPAGWLGQRVFAFHPHSSVFTADPSSLIPLPKGLSDEDALFLANMETAMGLMLDGRPLIGERVLVIGLGVVGLLASALLLQMPLLQVDYIDPLTRRLKRGEGFGGIGLRASPEPPFNDYDLVFELSGNPDGLKTAIARAGVSGRVVIGSWYGARSAMLDLGGRFHRSKLTLYSSQVSEIDPSLSGRWTKRRRLDLALAQLSRINPRRLITHAFDIDQAGRGYELLDTGHPEALQVIFRYPTQ